MKIKTAYWVSYFMTDSYFVDSDDTEWTEIFANHENDDDNYSLSGVLVRLENGNRYLYDIDFPSPERLVGRDFEEFDRDDFIPVSVIGGSAYFD